MAISRIASQDATGSGTTTANATYPAQPTRGNLLIAIFANNGITTSPVNSGWIATTQSASSATATQLYYKVAGVGEPKTVTMTTDGSASASDVAIYEYNGFSGVPTLDKTVQANSSITAQLTSPTGTTATTVNANELLFAAASWFNAAQTLTSWSASFTARNSVAGNLFTADRIVAATSAYTTTVTVTGTAGNTSALLATFYGDTRPTLNNYQFPSAPDGISVTEKIR